MRRGRVVVTVATAALLSGCDPAERAGAPAAVTQSGDTTIIVPALDGPTGRLVSDLVIGADESNPDALFGRVADAAFGPDGEIYVVDAQASAVSVFGRDGAFRDLLTRRGDGPGEVHDPTMVTVGPDGSIAVVSLREVEIFDPAGAPRASVSESEVRPPIRFDDAGRLQLHHGPAIPPLSATWRVGGNGVRRIDVVRGTRTDHAVVTLDPDGGVLDTVAGPFDVEDLPCPVVPESPSQRLCIFVAYASVPWFDWLPDGRRIEGRTDRYQLDISHPTETPVVSIRVPREPMPMPRAVASVIEDSWNGIGVEAFDTLFDPAPVLPAIAGVLPARDGRILVRIHADPEPATGEDGGPVVVETHSRFDVFTPEGEHRGYVTGPADLDVRDMRGDTLLTIRTGPLGVPIVERFVIEWSEGSR